MLRPFLQHSCRTCHPVRGQGVPPRQLRNALHGLQMDWKELLDGPDGLIANLIQFVTGGILIVSQVRMK